MRILATTFLAISMLSSAASAQSDHDVEQAYQTMAMLNLYHDHCSPLNEQQNAFAAHIRDTFRVDLNSEQYFAAMEYIANSPEYQDRQRFCTLVRSSMN